MQLSPAVPHFFPRFSCLEMGAAVWREAVGCCWLLLGSGGCGLFISLPWVSVSRWHGPATRCHSAATEPRRGVPRCERKDSAVPLAFAELRERFQGAAKLLVSFCALPRAAVSQAMPGAAGCCCDASLHGRDWLCPGPGQTVAAVTGPSWLLLAFLHRLQLLCQSRGWSCRVRFCCLAANK